MTNDNFNAQLLLMEACANAIHKYHAMLKSWFLPCTTIRITCHIANARHKYHAMLKVMVSSLYHYENYMPHRQCQTQVSCHAKVMVSSLYH